MKLTIPEIIITRGDDTAEKRVKGIELNSIK